MSRRFPNYEEYVVAGLLNENEVEIINDLGKKFPGLSLYFVPLVWASSVVLKARELGRIRDDFAVKTLIDELSKIRGSLGTLTSYHGVR